jgi:tetratricopeptide (TPR) repeat protein
LTIPAEKTNEIITRLSQLRRDPRNADEFTVALIKQEIERLKSVNISRSYMLQGMLETVLFNQEKTISHFEKALLLSDRDKTVLWNYASSLLSFGIFDDSEKLFLELANSLQRNDEIAKELFRMGKYQLAKQFSTTNNENLNISEAAEHFNLDDADISKAIQIAGSYLVNNGFLISGARILFLGDRIVHYILTAADPESLADLEYQMVEELFDNEVDIEHLVISYMGLGL